MAAAFTSAAVIAVIFALAAMAFYLAAEILAAALFLMEDIKACSGSSGSLLLGNDLGSSSFPP